MIWNISNWFAFESNKQNNTFLLLVLSGLVCLACLGRSAQGQGEQVTLEQIQAWLDKEWQQALDNPIPKDVKFSYTVEYTYVPSKAEMDKLRAQVKGHPDHPRRSELENYEWRIKNGPSKQEITFWFHSPQTWRMSTTYHNGGDLPYFDNALSNGIVWKLTSRQLTMFESSRAEEVGEAYFPYGPIEQASNRARDLFFASLGYPSSIRNKGDRPKVVAFDGKEWTAEYLNKFNYLQRWHGHWDSEADRGFVDDRTVLDSDGHVVLRDAISGWKYLGEFHIWVASLFDKKGDGPTSRRYRFVSIERVSPKDIQKVVALPDIAGADPVRGDVTVSSVRDLRESTDTIQYVDNQSRDVVSTLPANTPRAQEKSFLRIVGWITLGLLALMFGWLKYRKSM